jgi:hypothetical protein
MSDDTTELFSFPAVGRKKLTAAFDMDASPRTAA